MYTWARTVFRVFDDGHVCVAGGGVAVAAGALNALGLVRCIEPHNVLEIALSQQGSAVDQADVLKRGQLDMALPPYLLSDKAQGCNAAAECTPVPSLCCPKLFYCK